MFAPGAAINTDDENEEEEYEAWKVRELRRIKTVKEEREAREKEVNFTLSSTNPMLAWSFIPFKI